jgi:hypothetical protein
MNDGIADQARARWSSSPTINRGDLSCKTPCEKVGGSMQV